VAWELQGLVCILGPPRSSSLVFFLLARYVSMLAHVTRHPPMGFGHGIWLYQYRFPTGR
jgi:hypothetical protein